MLSVIKQYFKIFLVEFIHLVFHIFWVFPIRDKQICFSAYWKQYACNPKYIYEYLKAHCGDKLLYIWIGNNVNNVGDFHTIFVQYRSIRCLFYFLTSKIIITNVNFPVYIPYRKDQILINTWHGGGAYKNMGTKEIEKKMNLYKTFVIKKMRAQVIFYISSCRKFTSIMSEQMLINMDKFLPYGMPRNDLFFSSLLDKNIIKNKMGVDISTSIILYAPTYRGSFRNCNFTVSNISIPDVISAATTRFNKKFVFLYKAHHVMKDIDKNKDLGINVTSYPDMQELLYISDILITDYSSSIWDFSFTYKPCFLYAPDLENYKIEFGFYTPIETWPFPLAQSNMELKEKILTFDDEKYHENVVKHHKDLGSYENGTATETIVKKILSYIK